MKVYWKSVPLDSIPHYFASPRYIIQPLLIPQYFSDTGIPRIPSHQLMVSSSASLRTVCHPLSLVYRHESTMSLVVCCSSHEQLGNGVNPHLYRKVLQGRWPVWKRFNSNHVQQGRWKPSCWVVRSITVVRFTAKADCQSFFHCVLMSVDDKSDQRACRDKSKRQTDTHLTACFTGQPA